ncbi:MAG: nitroreductase family protein [Spirochaetes bacterium]|nr:nitroreductase family protein [Spirochaetota bacterium]
MIDILRTRRSIRKFKDRKIEEEKIEIIREAMLRSPSGRTRNPWRFVFVDNKDLIEKLSKAKEHGSAFMKSAALAIAVCGDEKESDTWIEDCSIAAVFSQLTAHSLGLGSCWVHIRNRKHSDEITSEEYVRGVLSIPESLRVHSVIAAGYSDEEKDGIPKDELQYDKIKYNGF